MNCSMQRKKVNSVLENRLNGRERAREEKKKKRPNVQLLIAQQVWEDQSVWNVDFLPVFDNLTAQDLNKLERQFLALLQYNVSLTASLYAKYYFELRTFSKVDSLHFPLQPLDKLNAKRLEVRTT